MSELLFEIFISLILLFAGLPTFAFRNMQHYFIGFRVGYTYMSEKAWREANKFVGASLVAFSLMLLGLALVGVKLNAFVLVMIVGVTTILLAGTWIARRAYEEEELSIEAPEKPRERIKVSVKPYLIAQLLGLVAYFILVAFLWNSLPERVAIHFDASGEPDNFAPKTVGALLFPLAVYPFFVTMTYLLREPAFAPQLRFSEWRWRAFAEFMTLMALGIILLDALGLLYNVGYISSSWIEYAVWAFLAISFVMIFRLFGRRGDEA